MGVVVALLLMRMWGVVLAMVAVYLFLRDEEGVKPDIRPGARRLSKYLHGDYAETLERLEGMKGQGRFSDARIREEQDRVYQQLLYNYGAPE